MESGLVYGSECLIYRRFRHQEVEVIIKESGLCSKERIYRIIKMKLRDEKPPTLKFLCRFYIRCNVSRYEMFIDKVNK